MTELTAIIPTRDRVGPLDACLATLQAQTVSPTRIEVIVVDDGGAADIRDLVEAASEAGPISMRCERQEPSGLNAARNRGAALASGGVLAFLDDDTLVTPSWAAALLRAFEDEMCGGVGGRVELKLEGQEPPWLAAKRSYLAEFDLGEQPLWLDDKLVPVGANCAVRREAFDEVGGFRAGLDRIGQSLVSNGDTEFFRRLRTRGYRLRYEPDARVLHCVPEERLTIDYFMRRARAQGISDELLRTVSGEPPSWRRRGRELIRLGRAFPILARNLLLGKGTVNARLWVSYCRGRLSAVGAKANRD